MLDQNRQCWATIAAAANIVIIKYCSISYIYFMTFLLFSISPVMNVYLALRAANVVMLPEWRLQQLPHFSVNFIVMLLFLTT